MDFERVLRQWEDRQNKRGRYSADEPDRRRALERWLSMYPPQLDKAEDDPQAGKGQRTAQPSARRLPVEAELDLHGHTVEEASKALDAFIENARGAGQRKILVIHGKGKHSPEKAVLGDFVRKFLQAHASIGEIGTPKRDDGGSGATWAIVRGYRSR